MTNFKKYKRTLKLENFRGFLYENKMTIYSHCSYCPAKRQCELLHSEKNTCWDEFRKWAESEAQ